MDEFLKLIMGHKPGPMPFSQYAARYPVPSRPAGDPSYAPPFARDAIQYTPEQARALAPVLASTAVTAAFPEVGAAMGLFDVYKGAQEMGRTGGKEGKLQAGMGAVNALLGGPALAGRAVQAGNGLRAMGQSGHAMVPFGEGQAIKAYHGSPHDFDKFSMDKIGTGEGAQVYGHGLYFAENEGVARDYRDKFAVHGDAAVVAPSGEALQVPAWVQQRLEAGRADDVIKEFKERLAEIERVRASHLQPWLLDDQKQGAERIIRAAEIHKTGESAIRPAARMYEVAIKAHPDEFLDWDAPLGQQPEKIRKAIVPTFHQRMIPTGMENADDVERGYTGQQLYRELQKEHAQRWENPSTAPNADAAASLREAGIKGIKYLDQGSRAGGKGTHNYVVFDDALVEILKKYGIAGLLAAGTASQAKPKPKGLF